jgi:hypothetical protein
MFTDSEEESKINHYNNDTKQHKSDNSQEVNDLLDFAENLKARCDKFLDRIFLLNTLQVFFGFSILGFSLVIFNLIPGLYLGINLLLVVLIYFGWILLFLFIEASSKTLRLRVSTDRRVLNSTIDLLRENSSVLAQDWSNLQKIQLQIKLSVFDVNTSVNPWLKLKNLLAEDFLLWASGVNINVLNGTGSSNEISKYKSIGFSICSTALLSFITGVYTFYTIFANEIASTFLGLLWSVTVLNVERTIAMTVFIRKQDNFNIPNLIFTNAVRLFLLILISLTISLPLELRILQPEIENYISANNLANTIKEDDQIGKIDRQISFVVDKINYKNQEIINLERRFNSELSGKISEKNKGIGSIAASIKGKIAILLDDISKSEKSKNLLEKQREARVEILKNTGYDSGLATRLDTLYKLYMRSPVMMSLGYSIRTMIVLIEILPILSKFLMRDTLHEKILRREQNELVEKEIEMREKMLSQTKEH